MYLIGFYSKKSLFKLNKFDYYKKSFKDLATLDVKVIYFYAEDDSFVLESAIIQGIKETGVEVISFKNESEIIEYLKILSGKIFINTFEEQEIAFTNRIRKAIGQRITTDPDIFLSKYLQRNIIGQQFPETTVQCKKVPIEQSKSVTEQDFPLLPCIVKPISGIQSSGVSKINNYTEYIHALSIIQDSFQQLENKRLKNEEILLEEFIDGKMYTVDYYVDEDQHIIVSKPVLIKLGIDYGIDDFCNISRFISQEVEKEVDQAQLHDFIHKTVVGGDFRNTFVHHEFKINSKGTFKTIETNGRIGGFRLDMYQVAYNLNLLRFPFEVTAKDYSLQNNVAMFAIYPSKTCIFQGYNEDVLRQIESLKSFHRLNTGIIEIGTKIGLTQNGYGKVGSIELANPDCEIFKKDVAFLESIYFDIIKTV